MKQFSQLATRIFQEAIQAYELRGSVDTPCTGNPYPEHTICLLYTSDAADE